MTDTERPEIRYGDFTAEVLASKLETFIRGLTLFPTHIGEVSRDVVYTGLDLCQGETEENAGRLLRYLGDVTVIGGNVFSETARKSVAQTGNKELMSLVQDIENFKLLPFPVTLDNRIINSNKKEGCEIKRIQAEYKPSIKRVPLQYKYNNGRFIINLPLIRYMKRFRLQGIGSMLQPCLELEFCTGNYMKTAILHSKDKVLIIDCDSIYTGEDKEGAALKNLGPTHMLDKIVTNGYIPTEFNRYFTDVTVGNILNHQRWIVPYLCGDEKHIMLNAKGKPIYEETEEERQEAEQERKQLEMQEKQKSMFNAFM